MFDQITLRRSIDGPAITAGEIAEAMLFYRRVHLVMDYGSFVGLIKKIGMPSLLRCLSMPTISATYMESMAATRTDQTSTGPEHSLVAFRLAGHEGIRTLDSKKARLEYVFKTHGYDRRQIKSYVSRFRTYVRYRDLTDDHYVPGGLLKAAQRDLLDPKYVRSAAHIIAEALLERSIPSGEFVFDIYFAGDKFRIDTTLDFSEITRIRKLRDPASGTFTPAHITSEILTASIDTLLAGHYGSDYYTSATTSKIIQLREEQLLSRCMKNQHQIRGFKELVLSGFPDVAAVINGGGRSFDEFLDLVPQTKKFKEWLNTQSPDDSLTANYLEQVSGVGWVASMPGKLVRMLVGEAIGLSSPGTGFLASVADNFVVEKLFKGWRPNHFVTRRLRPFVEPES